MHNAHAASSTNLPNSLGERVISFPSLTTRLVLATSFDVVHGYQTRLHYLGFIDNLGRRGNKGGITVPMSIGKGIRAIVCSI